MKADNSRRRFFKIVTGAAATASVLTVPLTKADNNTKPAAGKTTRGYRETRHIRDYYRSLNR